MRCSKCKEVKHIGDFYVQNGRVTWFVDRWGEKWGRPSSQCKSCMRGYYTTLVTEDEDTPESLEIVGKASGLSDDPDTFSPPDPVKGFVPLGPPPSPEGQWHPADDPNWLTEEDIATLNSPMELSSNEETPTEPQETPTEP
jgi:hypothetical protein